MPILSPLTNALNWLRGGSSRGSPYQVQGFDGVSQAQVLWHVQSKKSKLRTQVHWEILWHFYWVQSASIFPLSQHFRPLPVQKRCNPLGITYPLDPQWTRASEELKKGLTPPTKIVYTCKYFYDSSPRLLQKQYPQAYFLLLVVTQNQNVILSPLT